jgi:polyhydroxyalkanoate synthesis repressor PhaR
MAYVIKRYSNRKLYDPQTSCYVTLEELAERIRAGQEITVLESSSGEDITAVILTQILLDTERHHQTTLPISFLHQLVQYGARWQDVAFASLKANLDGLFTSQREADRLLRQWATQCGWLLPPPPPADQPAAAAPDDMAGLKQEIVALREQLQALSSRLDQASGSGATPVPPPP